jgi:FkbM family methyltransferase
MLKSEPFGTFADSKPSFEYPRLLQDHKSIPGWMRRYFKKLPQDFVVDRTLNGINFRCYPSSNAHDKIIWRERLFEHEESEFSFLTERLRSETTFVDIGANVGAVCIPVAVRCSWLHRTIAIEPDPIIYARLNYNLSINSLAGKVFTLPVAVGEAEKNAWLSKKASNAGQNSLIDNKTGNGITVRVTPLLSICETLEIESIGALKIDIEGYEDRALMPFFRAAPRTLWPKSVVIEHTSAAVWLEDCIAYMQSNGYTVANKSKMNTMLDLDLL